MMLKIREYMRERYPDKYGDIFKPLSEVLEF